MKALYGIRWALRAIYPIRCACCNRVIVPTESGFCDQCAETINQPQIPVCPFCAQDAKRCACLRTEHYYARCVAPFYYEGELRKAVTQLKEKHSRTAAQVLAYHIYSILYRDMPHLKVDAIVPVPLSKSKKRERGYNQSEFLSDALSHYMKVPVLSVLERRDIPYRFEQKRLPSILRSGNVLGVFDVVLADQIRDKILLLVDDTRTTGATLDECAKMLRIFGAKSVYVAVAATVAKKKEKDVS